MESDIVIMKVEQKLKFETNSDRLMQSVIENKNSIDVAKNNHLLVNGEEFELRHALSQFIVTDTDECFNKSNEILKNLKEFIYNFNYNPLSSGLNHFVSLFSYFAILVTFLSILKTFEYGDFYIAAFVLINFISVFFNKRKKSFFNFFSDFFYISMYFL